MEHSIKVVGNNCCGCRACEQICMQYAISFIENNEGFLFPQVDVGKCNSCGLCQSRCPILRPNVNKQSFFYKVAYNRNEKELKKSSSGGIFKIFANEAICRHGAVVGCAYNSRGMPEHIIVKDEDELIRLQGSKYIESDIGHIYSAVREELKLGTFVLFSGTPCQVAGLLNFLNHKYENLVTMDIICHGVPSRKLYASYIKWYEDLLDGKIESFDFRSKEKHGWSLTYQVKYLKNHKMKKIEKMASLSPYYEAFLNAETYRESCYHCPYASDKRPGDITVGDFWGVEKAYPEWFDLRGVSCVILNTSNGVKFWNDCKDKICSMDVDGSIVIKNNGNLREPSFRPEKRNYIYKELNHLGFAAIERKYLRCRNYWRDYIKDKIPNTIRYKIKKVAHFTNSKV